MTDDIQDADTSVRAMTPKKFWETAAQWGSFITNGDPGACLYGFDEKGLVQSEEHRAESIDYIESHCRKAAIANGEAGEDLAAQNAELDALVSYLKTAPVEGAMPELDEFTKAYATALLWSSYDNADENGGDPLDDNYGPEHFDSGTLDRIIADCAHFQQHYGSLLTEDNRSRSSEYSALALAGHDFWLTRAGTGAGFDDGDWKDPAGDVLAAAARSYRELEIEVGDNGFIHGWGGTQNPDLVEGAPEPEAVGPRP